MEEYETLRHYLDRIDIGPNDNSPLIIIHGNTELNVSRRYLESDPMKYYLDMVIVDYDYPVTNFNGIPTIKFWLEKEKEVLIHRLEEKMKKLIRKN